VLSIQPHVGQELAQSLFHLQCRTGSQQNQPYVVKNRKPTDPAICGAEKEANRSSHMW
jgi:hypothetical protein